MLKPTLSPSRAGDFQRCPLLFRLRVVDKLPEPASLAASKGTLVHAVLEELFSLPMGQRTLDRAQTMLPEQWNLLRERDPRLAELFGDDDPAQEATWLASAIDLLGNYFQIEDPNRYAPAALEQRVETTLDSGLRLSGIIDRVDVAPDGRIRIIDYKSGKSPGIRFQESALTQMKFYALVVWRTRGVIPTLLQLYYLADKQILALEPTEEDLLATERRMQALWDAISEAYEHGDFPPNPSKLCNWCSFQDICPAFGGTPPPFSPPADDAPALPLS